MLICVSCRMANFAVIQVEAPVLAALRSSSAAKGSSSQRNASLLACIASHATVKVQVCVTQCTPEK